MFLQPNVRSQRRTRSVRPLCFTFALGALLTSLASGLTRAQTVEDGVMLARGTLYTGVLYGHSSWDHYWEGSLQRTNGNFGTVTTQSATLAGNYGVTNRLNVIASAPYVWTNASQGVLHGQSGFQDLTVAAKFNALRLPVKNYGSFRAIAVLAGVVPLTNYSPDILPLSIGTHSKELSGRATLNFNGRYGLYLNGSAAYTFRGKVMLDRPFYYTNDQIYFSSEVAMPNQFNYSTSVGYYRRDLKVVGNFTQVQTRGGGDIRRQDTPFVSNRTNSSSAGVELQYPLPRRLRDIQYWASYSNTFDGRNVGQSNTLVNGIMYTFRERRIP